MDLILGYKGKGSAGGFAAKTPVSVEMSKAIRVMAMIYNLNLTQTSKIL